MDYPRELNLGEEREQALRMYLDIEIQTHRSERSAWVDDLRRWQEDYWSTPSSKEATFPFKGACNVIIPLTAIAVESIHAREMTTLFALPQFTSCSITSPETQEQKYDLERAIDWELLKGCDIYNFADQALLENKKLGTCVGKVGFEKIVKTAVRMVGNEEQDFDIVVKQGPTCDAVPLANFIMPFVATDPQIAPWCGEEHLSNFYDVEQKINSGLFRKQSLEQLRGYFAQGQNLASAPYTESVRREQKQAPVQYPRELGWYEIALEFDVDSGDVTDQYHINDNKKKEIIVHYHYPSHTFLSIRYNWYSDLHRSWRICNYFPMEHRWAGIGIGKMNEQFQEVITAQERQRIDNGTLANMRMFKAKQGSGISPNEPVFPGKIWMVEEMDDFQAVVGGSEVYPSSYNNSNAMTVFSQQRVGNNELNMGQPQAGTPETASVGLTRVQEYSRKFDYAFTRSKRFLKQIILDVLCVQQQFGFRDRRYFDTLGPNGQFVEQLLSMDPADIRSELFFTVDVVGQDKNDVMDRNNWTQYGGLLTQYWQQMIELAQLSQNPQLISVVMAQAMMSGTEAMRQISEGFDIRQVDQMLLPQQLLQLLTRVGQQGGLSGPPQLPPGQGGSRSPNNAQQGARVPNTTPLNQQPGSASNEGSR